MLRLVIGATFLLSLPVDAAMTYTIEDVSDSGRLIVLEDESVWSVESVDSVDSSVWLATSDVTIVKTGENQMYPFLIVNHDEKETVHAKYLGKL